MDIVSLAICLILQVESSNNTDFRSGDDGQAVGPYQMHKIAVREANRIEYIYAKRYKRNVRIWTYVDRSSLKQSTAMCELTLMWHYRRFQQYRYPGQEAMNVIDLACCWNKPNGCATLAYRNRVKKALVKLN